MVSLSSGDATLEVSFLPTRLGPHSVILVLQHKETSAQVAFLVQGHSAPAEPNAVLTWQCELSSPKEQAIKVPYVNAARREAFTHISRATAHLTNVRPPQTDSVANENSVLHLKAKINGCPHATCPDEVVLMSSDKMDNTSTNLPIDFHPVAVGTYNFTVTLQGSGDTRVFKVIAHVVEAKKLNLACKSEIDDESYLEAAIYNPCSSAREFEARMSGNSAFSLDNKSRFRVKAHTETTLRVKFKPVDEGVFFGTLEVIDVLVGIAHNYSLHGVCELHKMRSASSSVHEIDPLPVSALDLPLEGLPESVKSDFSDTECDAETTNDWVCQSEIAFAQVNDMHGVVVEVESGSLGETTIEIGIEGDDDDVFAILKPRRKTFECFFRMIVLTVTGSSYVASSSKRYTYNLRQR